MTTLGDHCTEIPITVLFNDPDLIFKTSYAFFDSAKCQCRGDGRIAQKANGEFIECNPKTCETYLAKGYSKEWINQRLKSIEVRKELTDEWQERGMKQGLEYAILTNELTKTWAGKNVKEYKKLKGLKKENLRDNMTNLELVLNMLAEASTTEISKEKQPKGLEKNKDIARKGGNAAKKARLEIEKQTGKPIVTAKNAKKLLNKPNNKNIEKE